MRGNHETRASCADAVLSLGALFGTGRAGTTWLGSLVDTHPDVAYRFEPFHRLGRRPDGAQARRLLDDDRLGSEAAGKLGAFLLPADPLTDKPPFFAKRHRPLAGLATAWRAARTGVAPRSVYRALYSPRRPAHVVFKEVTMAPSMDNLVTRGAVPAVYLIRHPVAVCSSELRGQLAGKMPTWRQENLDVALAARPDLAALVTGPDRPTSLLAANAALWRLDVEAALDLAARDDGCLIVTYEELCADPPEGARHVLGHLGLDAAPQTLRFIDSLRDASASGAFSVMKDPARVVNRWRDQVTVAEHDEVMAVAGDSPAMARYAVVGAA